MLMIMKAGMKVMPPNTILNTFFQLSLDSPAEGRGWVWSFRSCISDFVTSQRSLNERFIKDVVISIYVLSVYETVRFGRLGMAKLPE
jgi:hypothetical protein